MIKEWLCLILYLHIAVVQQWEKAFLSCLDDENLEWASIEYRLGWKCHSSSKSSKRLAEGCDVDEIWYDRCSGTKPVIGFDIFPELCSFCKSEAKTYLKWKKGRDPWQSSKISECNSYRFCVSATPTHPRILDNGDRTFMSIVDKTAYDRQVDRWTNDR